jgi:hypothetical protein
MPHCVLSLERNVRYGFVPHRAVDGGEETKK